MAGWWDAGIRGYGKAQSFAERAYMSEGQLSKTRAGVQSFRSDALVAIEGDVGATLGFCGGLLHAIKHVAVPLVSEVQLEPGQAQLLRYARSSLGELWPAWRDRAAARMFSCDGALLEAALDLDALIRR